VDAQLRAEDWPVRLAQAIEDARCRPFAWGTHDCATWAFGVAARLRGDQAPKWAGTYKTDAGAVRRLKREGLALEDMGSAILGASLPSPLMAWRGDVVFADGAYGVCIGTHIAQVTKEGLTMKPLAAAEKAWRV
jgi:hypothetical protein